MRCAAADPALSCKGRSLQACCLHVRAGFGATAAFPLQQATAAAAGNTALGTEAARQALTSTTVTSNAVAYVASFAAGTGTGAVTEAGLLNASSGGTLLCRTVFSVVNKGANDSMTVTWTVTVS